MTVEELAAVADRFWLKVAVAYRANGSVDYAKCWPWQGAKTGRSNLYGQFSMDGRNHKAHRIAFWLHYKRRVPRHLDASHTCDNPPCCNPTHVRPASHRNNVQDWYFRRRAGIPAPRPTKYCPLTDTERAS